MIAARRHCCNLRSRLACSCICKLIFLLAIAAAIAIIEATMCNYRWWSVNHIVLVLIMRGVPVRLRSAAVIAAFLLSRQRAVLFVAGVITIRKRSSSTCCARAVRSAGRQARVVHHGSGLLLALRRLHVATQRGAPRVSRVRSKREVKHAAPSWRGSSPREDLGG